MWKYADIQEGDKVGSQSYFIRFAPRKKKLTRAFLLCSCGKEFEGILSNIASQNLGCGCRRKGKQKHGQCPRGKTTLEYSSWKAIKARCLRKNSKFYKYYGANGVKICDRWLGENGFANFLQDVGPRPSIYHTLDRYPNNKGNYEPGNVRWATQAEQMRNTTKNIFITFKGKTMILLDWSKETGIHRNTLSQRYHNGWSVEEMLTPVKTKP